MDRTAKSGPTPPFTISNPLVTATLGDTVVLAFRFGFQGHTIDLNVQRFFANRKGHSTSFIDTAGLGIVLRLRVAGDHPSTPALIPSRVSTC